MDEADRDIEMEKDPFLAAGIDIPEELPYNEETQNINQKQSEDLTLLDRTTSLVRKASVRLASNMTPKLNHRWRELKCGNTSKSVCLFFQLYPIDANMPCMYFTKVSI